jgi:hypothetical protein
LDPTGEDSDDPGHVRWNEDAEDDLEVDPEADPEAEADHEADPETDHRGMNRRGADVHHHDPGLQPENPARGPLSIKKLVPNHLLANLDRGLLLRGNLDRDLQQLGNLDRDLQLLGNLDRDLQLLENRIPHPQLGNPTRNRSLQEENLVHHHLKDNPNPNPSRDQKVKKLK